MTLNEIIKGCQNYDKKCQFELVNKYSGYLKTICRAYAHDEATAKDMVQESFMVILTKIEAYKPIGSFEGWMRTVTVNCALNWLRKRKLIKKTDLMAVRDDKMEPKIYNELSKEDVLKIIQALPDMHRLVFSLIVLEGYTHKEVGKELGIKEATSRSHFLRARRKLQEKLNLKKIKLHIAI